jgi:hypothetical protein
VVSAEFETDVGSVVGAALFEVAENALELDARELLVDVGSVRCTERVVLVSDVVFMAVVLDEPCSANPCRSKLGRSGERSEGGEVGGRVVLVAVDETVECTVDVAFDGGELLERVAVFGEKGVTRALVFDGMVEGTDGVVDADREHVDVANGREPPCGVFSAVSDRVSLLECGELFALMVEGSTEFVA